MQSSSVSAWPLLQVAHSCFDRWRYAKVIQKRWRRVLGTPSEVPEVEQVRRESMRTRSKLMTGRSSCDRWRAEKLARDIESNV